MLVIYYFIIIIVNQLFHCLSILLLSGKGEDPGFGTLNVGVSPSLRQWANQLLQAWWFFVAKRHGVLKIPHLILSNYNSPARKLLLNWQQVLLEIYFADVTGEAYKDTHIFEVCLWI
ncbi:hypothetical protein SLEP1_g7235 [Rubroshorea leprosula]|uniref:Uncharacterized protein n=1 Tax=Rubroshorea leprosula TaxID=152421 RepID=A0AAV5I7I4_9ROSI|nr:hypothetical protein SLEP1_g7235 [Rubroshorea leprosula]